MDLRFEVLGAPRAWYGDQEIRLGPPMQQAVAVYLATHANRVVPQRELIEAIWGDGRPYAAADSVYKYVSKLRRVLDPDRAPRAASDVLVSRDTGYLLRMSADSLDTTAFAHTVAAARELRESGDIDAALTQLEQGLRLWRGDALAGLPSGPFVLSERKRLREQQIAAEQQRGECLVLLGRHADAIPTLSRLVDAFPRRQALRALLMRALYADGRRDDALAVLGRLDPQRRTPELIELGNRIASGDPALTEQRAPARTVDQLPRDIRAFTGRVDELARLEKLLDTPEETPIAAIDGTAGVGKTALALRFAHRVADRFPDGRLYLNLRGIDPTPLQALDALGQLLRSIGVDTAQLPENVDERAAYFRSVVAGKRLLLVLDNAQSSEQVRPLLPGAGECLVIVTSRARLSGLVAHDDAERIPVTELDDEQSRSLIARIVGPERVNAERDPAQRLAELCGRLPLALRIAAANLDAQPDRSLTDFCTDLESGDRISALAIAGDELAGVQAAFDQSYHALSPDVQELYRRLSVVPGPDFTCEAAAALIDTSPATATERINELATMNLVETHLTGRFRQHDLLRLHARRCVADDEPELSEAWTRLMSFYVATARAASALISPSALLLPDVDASEPFADRSAAMQWMQAEEANLLAAVHTQSAGVYYLVDAIRMYLQLSCENRLLRGSGEIGLEAAIKADDPAARAAMRYAIGCAHLNGSQYAEAEAVLTEMAADSRASQWRQAEATAENALGVALDNTGQNDRATQRFERSLEINRELGNLIGEASNLINLSNNYKHLGRYRECLETDQRAVQLAREVGSHYHEVSALTNVGDIQLTLGYLADAEASMTSALEMARSEGIRVAEAMILGHLSVLHHRCGRHRDALDCAEEGIAVARETENEFAEAQLHAQLAEVLLDLDVSSAEEHVQTAIRMAEAFGEDGTQANALRVRAEVDARRGDHDSAARTLERVVGMARSVEARADARIALARVCRLIGDLDRAREQAMQALDDIGDCGYRLGVADAHVELAEIERADDRPDSATRHAAAAREIYLDAGAPMSGSVAGLVPGGADPD